MSSELRPLEPRLFDLKRPSNLDLSFADGEELCASDDKAGDDGNKVDDVENDVCNDDCDAILGSNEVNKGGN
jgi:hypothetical protein